MIVLIYYTDSGKIRSKSELPPRASSDHTPITSLSAASVEDGCSSIVMTPDVYDGPYDVNRMDFSEMSVIDGVFTYTPTPKIPWSPGEVEDK